MPDFPLNAYAPYYAPAYQPVGPTGGTVPVAGYDPGRAYGMTTGMATPTAYVGVPSYQAQLAAMPGATNGAQLANVARLAQALLPEDAAPVSAAAAGAMGATLPLAPLRAGVGAAPLTTIRATPDAAAAAAVAGIDAQPAADGATAVATPTAPDAPTEAPAVDTTAVTTPVAAPAAEAPAATESLALGSAAVAAPVTAGTRVVRGARRRGSELWAGVRDPRTVHVTQVQSRYNPSPTPGNRDCGPASVLMALRLVGLKVPGLAAKASPQRAVDRVRTLTGATSSGTSTTNLDLEHALTRVGATTQEVADAESIRQSVLAGNPVILNGNPRNRGAYGAHFTSAQLVPFNGPHWIVVSGVDAKTGEFIINDPLSKVGPVKVTPAMLEAYRGGSLGIEVAA